MSWVCRCRACHGHLQEIQLLTGPVFPPPAPPAPPPALPKAPPQAPDSSVPLSPSPQRQDTAASDAIFTSMNLDALDGRLDALDGRLDHLGSRLNGLESSVGNLFTEQKRLSGKVQEISDMMASMQSLLQEMYTNEKQVSTRMFQLLAHISKKTSDSSGSRSGSLEETSPAQREVEGQPCSQSVTGPESKSIAQAEEGDDGTSVSGSSWSKVNADTIQTAVAVAEEARVTACRVSMES